MKKFQFRLPKFHIDWEEDIAQIDNVEQISASSPQLENLDKKSSRKVTAQTSLPQTNSQTNSVKKRNLFDYILGTNRPPIAERSLTARIFGLRFGQFLNLFLWSVMIGVVMKLTNFNPLQPQFDATATAGNVWQQGLAALGWAIKASWKPALTGTIIVLPIWLAWRLITLPFRR